MKTGEIIESYTCELPVVFLFLKVCCCFGRPSKTLQRAFLKNFPKEFRTQGVPERNALLIKNIEIKSLLTVILSSLTQAIMMKPLACAAFFQYLVLEAIQLVNN